MTKNQHDAIENLSDAVKAYVVACGGIYAPETKQPIEAMRQGLALVRMADSAEDVAELERAIRGPIPGRPDVWPGWVYEARQAIWHRNMNVPWLPALQEALGWQSGTIHDALQAVRRLVEAEKERTRTNQ